MSGAAAVSEGATPEQRAAALRLMIFDVDGVLTDGRLHIGAQGVDLAIGASGAQAVDLEGLVQRDHVGPHHAVAMAVFFRRRPGGRLLRGGLARGQGQYGADERPRPKR